MNRDQLIQTAIRLIAAGDHPGDDYEIRIMCFVGAIAKLLLAQTMPMDSDRRSRPVSPDADASPRITHRTWLPGDPV